jgi:nitroreductase
MDAFEAITKRISIRNYQEKPLPKELIDKLLEAARVAPTASNKVSLHFIVVTDSEKRKKLAGPLSKFIRNAPVAIVGCGDTKASPKWCKVDVAIAMQNMVIAATGEGLGTCWVGSFDEAKIKLECKIPEHFEVVALLAVGYPVEGRLAGGAFGLIRRRKKLQDIVSYEEYGKYL